MHRNRTISAIATASICLVIPAFAGAHADVASTNPKEGSTVSKSLTSVKVTFGETVRNGTIKVYGPSGTKVSKGNGGRDPRNVKRIVVSLKANLKAGKYHANWTATAADGHKQSGTIHFRLKG